MCKDIQWKFCCILLASSSWEAENYRLPKKNNKHQKYNFENKCNMSDESRLVLANLKFVLLNYINLILEFSVAVNFMTTRQLPNSKLATSELKKYPASCWSDLPDEDSQKKIENRKEKIEKPSDWWCKNKKLISNQLT